MLPCGSVWLWVLVVGKSAWILDFALHSACPCVVDQVKTTGLADGEEHHVTELSSRADAVARDQDCPGW